MGVASAKVFVDCSHSTVEIPRWYGRGPSGRRPRAVWRAAQAAVATAAMVAMVAMVVMAAMAAPWCMDGDGALSMAGRYRRRQWHEQRRRGGNGGGNGGGGGGEGRGRRGDGGGESGGNGSSGGDGDGGGAVTVAPPTESQLVLELQKLEGMTADWNAHAFR